MMWVWMSLDVAKQQAKLGTPTAEQSRQLPGKASFMVARTHRHACTHAHTEGEEMHIDMYAHTAIEHTHLL